MTYFHGPVLGRPIVIPRAAKATRQRAEAAELLAKADASYRDDPTLAAGYRDRAAELVAAGTPEPLAVRRRQADALLAKAAASADRVLAKGYRDLAHELLTTKAS